jgi:hypothetical protein
LVVVDFIIAPVDRVVSPLWIPGRNVDLAAVSEMDLRYEYFWSSIRFAIDGFDLGADWGNVPLLDFSASVKSLIESIGQSSRGAIDFTENIVVVSFVRSGELVEVRSSNNSNIFVCGVGDLMAAFSVFLEKVAVSLLDAHPAIGNNEFFRKLTAASP